MKTENKLIGWVVGIGAVIIAGLVWFGTPSDPPTSAPQPPRQPKEVSAKVYRADTFIMVENVGEETWGEGTEVYLNGEPMSEAAFHYHLGVLQPANPYKIALRDFTRADGKRFNPQEYKAVAIWIGGGKYDWTSYSVGQ